MNKVLESGIIEKASERRIVHIINPTSGSGKKLKKTKDRILRLGEEIYLTKCEGDCGDFIAELLTKDPYAHVVAYGGDGTMGEAAGGIMAAGAGKTALFTGVPSGSGNDFLHYMYTEKNVFGKKYPVDLILANGKYGINVVNMGFDCDVVSEAEKIRKVPGLGGGFSYIAGVAVTFVKKDSFCSSINFEGCISPDSLEVFDDSIRDEFLLVALANGKYYGGGFNAAPLADCADGYIDVIAVKNVSRPVFISLIADYKKGCHLDLERGCVKDKFKSFVYYRRCKKVSFDGIERICYDGEIVPAESITAQIVPNAIVYTPPKKAWLS